jgi:hypothetical protein
LLHMSAEYLLPLITWGIRKGGERVGAGWPLHAQPAAKASPPPPPSLAGSAAAAGTGGGGGEGLPCFAVIES